MAVRNVSIFQIQPGRRQDFLNNLATAKKVLERLGGRYRVAQTTFGGPNTGNVVVALEFDDMAAYAAFTQKAQGDSEWQPFQTRLNGVTDPTATVVSRSLLTDIEV